MITLMRRHRKALQVGLLLVIAAFVASLFVFGASGIGGGGGEPDAVATVNGESIQVERYQRRYQAYVEAYAQIYRDRFSQELAERL
ncbi:MAG: SurA N-terminal domain-containing protein, partial [candidate division NC10 bacterium]